MTMLEDDDMVVQALRAGARGYLVKGAAQREILDAIRGVHAGQAVIGSDVARRLAGARRRRGRPRTRSPTSPTASATSSTCSPPAPAPTQIADRLGLSDKTVRNHLSNIFTKLEASTAPRPSSRLAPPGSHDKREHAARGDEVRTPVPGSRSLPGYHLRPLRYLKPMRNTSCLGGMLPRHLR